MDPTSDACFWRVVVGGDGEGRYDIPGDTFKAPNCDGGGCLACATHAGLVAVRLHADAAGLVVDDERAYVVSVHARADVDATKGLANAVELAAARFLAPVFHRVPTWKGVVNVEVGRRVNVEVAP